MKKISKILVDQIKKIINENNFLFFIVVIFLISFASDIFKLTVINTLLSEVEFFELLVTLFGVQASISTLGVALIALLIESIKEKRYGIRIGHFVMTNHIKLLTHQSVIICELVLLFASYLSLVFKLLNTAVALFTISLLLIVFLTNDILKLFINREQIDSEIKGYILQEFLNQRSKATKNLLTDFNNHLGELAYESKILEFKDNLELYYHLYENIDDVSRSVIEMHFEDIFKRLSYYNNQDVNEELCMAILKMYKVANEKGIYVNFFDNLQLQLFEVLSSLPQNYYYKSNKFPYLSIYTELKENDRFNDENNHNRKQTLIFSNNIYLSMFQKVSWSESFKRYRIKGFYDLLWIDYNKGQNNDGLKELNGYTRSLINNHGDLGVFFSNMKSQSYELNQTNHNHFLVILAYIFYILYETTDFTGLDRLKLHVEKELEKNNEVGQYLAQINLEQIKLDDLFKNIKYQLGEWEFYPDLSNGSSAKMLIFDKVATTFLISLFVSKANDIQQLKNYIKSSGMDIQIIYNYTIKDSETFQEWYNLFIECFNQLAINNKHEALKLLNVTLNSQIVEQKIVNAKNINEAEKYQEAIKLTNNVKECLNKRLNDVFITDIEFDKTKVIEEELTECFSINIFSEINFMEKHIMTLCNRTLVSVIYKLLKNNFKQIEILQKDKSKFEVLIEELDLAMPKPDLKIGSINLSRYHRDTKFEEVQKRLNEVEIVLNIAGMTKELILLNSRDIRVKVIDLSVRFINIDRDHILKNVIKIGDKFEFNDMSSNEKFIFSEEELVELFSLKYRNVEWKLKFQIEYNSRLEGLCVSLN